jgi:cysteine synthase
MSRIIPKLDEATIAKTAKRCKERGIRIPTFAELRDPTVIPKSVTTRLPKVGLWDVDPVNLYRITWKNDVQTGLYGRVNRFEIPSALSGVNARIVGLVGKYVPTGAHKVGAAFGCLVPRLVAGEFDPTRQKAVWPSTGNYCRGGVFDCALLACPSIAILPEEMSRERFEWLRATGADEIFATPGSESNVKEIYDKCHELRRERGDAIVIFNQFDEFGNAVWHYHTTGTAIAETFRRIARDGDRLRAYVSATGSAGTLAAGDYLKSHFPSVTITAVEALQCPTLSQCGFGAHRIEGIGDKHVPWIHNARNTDLVCAVDDEQCMALLRLANEAQGRAFLASEGFDAGLLDQLPLLGISSLCNLVAAIQTARYYELGAHDCLFTVLTDSVEMYRSRLTELTAERGPYPRERAARDFSRHLEGIGTDHLRELSYRDRKAIHNLKYFTWVEQQGRTVEELSRLWDPDSWVESYAQVDAWDEQIREFNRRTGLGGGA